VVKMNELYKQLFAESRNCIKQGVFRTENSDFGVSFYDILIPELKKSFGNLDLSGYVFYHILIGSTPLFDFCIDYDLPGDRIIHFADDLLERLKKANEVGVFE